jgi:hypothetical protein
MPVTKIAFRPGINKEITVYANEGGFVACNKVRFRTGYPEKIGGWTNYSPGNTFEGIARTFFNWITYQNENLVGMGTNQLYYIENGGAYHDITPIANTSSLNSPFTTTSGSSLVQVTDTSNGALTGTFVNITSATTVGGLNINGQYEIVSIIDANNYNIVAVGVASTSSTGGGVTSIIYKLNAGNAIYTIAGNGWGVPEWGLGGWGGSGTVATGIPLRLWSQVNFNQDLIFAQYNGPIYYWTKDTANYTPAITINTLASQTVKTSLPLTIPFVAGANSISITNALQIDIGATITGTGIAPGTIVPIGYNGGLVVPLSQATIGPSDLNNYNFSYSGNTAPNQTFQIVGSSTYQFIIAMGSTPYNPANFNPAFNPMLVRWTDQSNALEWTPTSYNQSGEQALSNGSYIIGSVSTRQEILIWTNSALFSMQYIGAPFVFGFTLLMDNISVISPNSQVTVSGVTYWMGVDKFYVYSGTVNTLPCTIRKYIYSNINLAQAFQVVSGFNERFNEVWWMYPSLNSLVNDSYVIFNYLENTWYYGTINRTAWLDSPLRNYPMAVFSIQTSYLNNAVGLTDMTITVLNGVSYPMAGTVIIDNEQISYTAISGNTFTGCIRGVNGTTPATHLAYAVVAYQIPNQIVFHEDGVDDNTFAPQVGAMPINSFLRTADFDISDGDHYLYVSRVLPDFAFTGSTAANPQITFTVYPRQNSGSAYQTNVDMPPIVSTATVPVEQFTGIIYTRVRGRQMAFVITSPNLGVFWQMGALRFDGRPDGKR